jgi:hypothetical protein
MKTPQSQFKSAAKWNALVHYGLASMGLLALLFSLLVAWLRSDG